MLYFPIELLYWNAQNAGVWWHTSKRNFFIVNLVLNKYRSRCKCLNGCIIILNKLFDICGRGQSTQNKILFYYTFIFDPMCVRWWMLLKTYLSVAKESGLRIVLHTVKTRANFSCVFQRALYNKAIFFLLLLFGRHFETQNFLGVGGYERKKSIKCKTDADLWEPSVLGFTRIGPALGSTSCGPGPYSSKARDLRLCPTRNFVRIFLKIQAQRTLGNCLFCFVFVFFFFFFPRGFGFLFISRVPQKN
jgi:hypothetical protein